jgi:hypothetical protein
MEEREARKKKTDFIVCFLIKNQATRKDKNPVFGNNYISSFN